MPSKVKIDVAIPFAMLRDPSGQNTRAIGTASQPSKQQVLVAGRDAIIPVIYGGWERTAGKLYTARKHPTNGNLVLWIVICEGPINAFGSAQLNDQDLTGPVVSGSTVTYNNGVSITYYDGTQTAVDPTLAECIPGLTEYAAGAAYAVCSIPKSVSTGFPRFAFMVQGMKVYDPRVLFRQVYKDLSTNWSDVGNVAYSYGAVQAPDGTNTGIKLTDVDETSLVNSGREFTWEVADDGGYRSASVCINKDVFATWQAGVGLWYSGGSNPAGLTVKVNLAAGELTVYSGSGQYDVIDLGTHWQVVVRVRNNESGHTTLTLTCYVQL